MTRNLGIHRSRGGKTESISIAKWLCDDPTLAEKAIDTLRHEVAHAIAGHAAGHGPAWRAACRMVGANPERTYTATDQQREQRDRGAKWSLTCDHPGCDFADTRAVVKRTLLTQGAGHGNCPGNIVFKDNRSGRVYRKVTRPQSMSPADVFSFNWR
jgi:hypothetical protein